MTPEDADFEKTIAREAFFRYMCPSNLVNSNCTLPLEGVSLSLSSSLIVKLIFQPSICGGSSSSGTRPRRQAGAESNNNESDGTPATIEVYSGLYVNEANDLAKAGLSDDSVFSEKVKRLFQ